MIIDCISDLHSFYPELEGGDLLIVAGDLTGRNISYEYLRCFLWLTEQKYKKIVLVAGNHDNEIEKKHIKFHVNGKITYFCDSGTEYEGLKIWGSPWTKTFPGMNPHCKAFTVDTEEELAEKWALIPDDIDILVTHSPPYGILDGIEGEDIDDVIWTGSPTLRHHVLSRIKPKIHAFGHIHANGGKMVDLVTTKFINASYVDESYEPSHRPVRITL